MFHISAGSCHPFVFPLEIFVYELLFYVLITTYGYLPAFKSYEDTLGIFLSINVRLHLFLIVPSLERSV